ncbi:MAG: hypothetical protein QXF70_00380 [Candidatus Bilamarchaeaceae archaeon]
MKNELIISFVFFIVLVIGGTLFFSPPPPIIHEELVYKETPLIKNKDFDIQPGEKLVYTVRGNYSSNFTFIAAKGNGCIWMFAEGGELLSCIKNDGTDGANSNISLKDPAIFFFKPWMLAIHDDWQWSAYACTKINNETFCDMPIKIKVIRIDYINSKKNYVVKIDFINISVYQWIEDERRIVTKEIGEGYELTLIE